MTTLSAKERWQRLDSKRQQVLERARECAKLTIPALVPPEGHTDNDELPTPYQSMGARGVNNLSSKILLAVLPPGQSVFRYQIAPKVREAMGSNITEAEQKLTQREQEIGRKIEGSNARPVMAEVAKHLVVAGNALMHVPDSDDLRMYRIDQFVICRAPNGDPLEAVVKYCASPSSLSEATIAACDVNPASKDYVDVFTVIEWRGTRQIEWQEINGKQVPGSFGSVPKEKSAWIPLRWTSVPGQDYGRSHVEEYLGDLRSLEGIYEAVIQFAAAAAKILFLVHPNSSTDFDDIVNAESGEAVKGNKNDIDVLQIEKLADFQTAKSIADELTLRLSHAFLLKSGTVRNAERVTAEEIRELAQELEDALGGVYTVLADEFQLPFVRLMIHEMQQARELPALPEKVVNPIIVTGFQALGRNHAVNKLRAFLNDLKALDPELTTVNKLVVARRLGVGWGVEDLDELLLTEEDMQSTTENNVAANIVDKTAAPVAGAVAKAVAGQ